MMPVRSVRHEENSAQIIRRRHFPWSRGCRPLPAINWPTLSLHYRPWNLEHVKAHFDAASLRHSYSVSLTCALRHEPLPFSPFIESELIGLRGRSAAQRCRVQIPYNRVALLTRSRTFKRFHSTVSAADSRRPPCSLN
jgi:hypothetical protein